MAIKRYQLPRLRFSLRTFLVLICIIGALLGLAAHRIETGKQRWAKIAELQRLGVHVSFDDDYTDWTPAVIADMTWWQMLHRADHALRLDSAQFTTQTQAPKAFELLRHFPNIDRIYLMGEGADDHVMDDLVRHKNLKYLDLSKSSVTDDGLARLVELPNLTSIDLPPGIGDIGIIHVAKLPRLGRVWGAGGPITDAGVKHLQSHTEMWFLNLRDTYITDEGVRSLAGMTSLWKLDLSGTRVTGQCAASFVGCKNLRRLELSRTRFNNAGLAVVGGLPMLQDLTLAETDVTDEGLVHLNGLNVLTWLDLSRTKVTAAGLAQLTKYCELTYLQICGLPVTDADAPMLAKIPMLLQLDCRETGITPAGEAVLLKSKVKCQPWTLKW